MSAERRRLSAVQRRAIAELFGVFPVADELGRRFGAAGHPLFLVGGSVRDAFLGRLGSDLDFTTDATPQQVMAITEGWAEASWTTGIEFGTIGLTKGGLQLEVTTFRADRYDRASRNPEVTFGDSLEDDLARRDFAVNAMAISVPEHEFVDPYDGLADITSQTLRTPGAPADSFADDPLRMLRAARFVAQLGFTPDRPVIEAITAMAGQIERITAERIQAELSKLLLGAHPRAGLQLLVSTGLADYVLPELPALRMEIDEHHQHKDVYVHSLTVLEQAIDAEDDGPDLVLRMAALLHDIGKPDTRRHEAGGGVSFHHHEVVGAKLVRRRLRALRYSKAFIEDVAKLVFLHLRFHGYGKGEWTDSAVRRYVTDAGDQLSRLHKLVRSDCTTRNKRRAAQLASSYDALEERIAALSEQEQLNAIRPDLDGNEIMRLLGIGPGPVIGRAYRHLLALRMEHGPQDHGDVVAELMRWASQNGITPNGKS